MNSVMFALALMFSVAPTDAAGQLPSTGDLFDRYARGDFSAFALPKTAPDLDRFRQALEHDADRWLGRGDARTQRRRQLIVATIALEAAHAGVELSWAQGRRLIEFGAAVLRRGKPDEGERLWHLAALSVIQGAHDNELLVGQQKLAIPRFEDEPRLLLALAVALESSTWPEPDRSEAWNDDENEVKQTQPFEYERRNRMRQAITALEDLSNAEAIRAESLLRLGYLHLRLRNVDVAIEQFDDVLDTTDDPFVLYLAHFLSGTAHEQQGDRANAVAEYRAALALVPRAQSASLALASLLFIGDDPDEAAVLADAAVASPLAEDPWRSYQLGDFRLWPERIAALREAIR